MFPGRSSDRVDLSTELGFAVVGGVAFACSTPGRVGRRVTERVSSMLDAAHDVTDCCGSRLRQLTGQR
jgi:hypothetical protein